MLFPSSTCLSSFHYPPFSTFCPFTWPKEGLKVHWNQGLGSSSWTPFSKILTYIHVYKRFWIRVSYHAPIALQSCDKKFEECCQEWGWIFCGAVLSLQWILFSFLFGYGKVWSWVSKKGNQRLTKDKIKAQEMHKVICETSMKITSYEYKISTLY